MIQYALFPDKNIVLFGRRAVWQRLNQLHKVAHLALEGDIRHQPVTGFGIETRQIAGIRIAIRVAVADVKDQDKVLAVIQAHLDSPSVDSIWITTDSGLR